MEQETDKSEYSICPVNCMFLFRQIHQVIHSFFNNKDDNSNNNFLFRKTSTTVTNLQLEFSNISFR